MAAAGPTLELTRTKVLLVAATLLLSALIALSLEFSRARNLVMPNGAVIGGDFTAFYAAGRASAAGDAAAPYDSAAFEALLKAHAPYKEYYGLFWQYPPTYYFPVIAFSGAGYLPGYALWVLLGGAAFLASLKLAGADRAALFVAAASPAAFQAAVTGQNGFFAAALLAFAALMADRRPILAGLAAAILTMKPQLGLLLPIAFAAAGCWRAFAAAAAGSAAFAAASLIAFGPETWSAFFAGGARAAEDVATGLLPLFKMATPFAAARFAGLPVGPAVALHTLAAIVAASLVAMVWRRTKEADLRAAVLSGAALIAAPYGFYYELTLLALPVLVLVRRGLAHGFLAYERPALALIYLAPLALPGDPAGRGVSIGLLIVIATFACVARRIAHDEPAMFAMPPPSPARGVVHTLNVDGPVPLSRERGQG